MPGATRWGNELLLNSIPGLPGVTQVTTTALPNGQFVAGWTLSAPPGTAWLEIFDAYGAGVIGPGDVNGMNPELDPAVVALSDGRFVAAWSRVLGVDPTTGKFLTDVYTEIVDTTGTIVVPQSAVNTIHTLNSQHLPDIAALAGNAGYVIVYLDDEVSPGSVRGQMYNFAGQKIGASEFFIGTAESSSSVSPAPHVAGLNDGGFVVTWWSFDNGGRDAFAQIYNASGAPVGGNLILGQGQHSQEPDVAVLPDGRFVVVWADDTHTLGDTSNTAVHGKIFNANGTPASAEFLVNTQTAGSQEDPVVTALPDGRFAVAWYDLSETLGDASIGGVHAQVFDTNGGKSGAEFLVNSSTLYDQIPQSITTLADGRFVVAYTDGSPGTSDLARAQIFDPRETAVNLPGTSLVDDLVGTPFDDTLHGAAGNDRLTGAGGNDALDGGAGADTMIGGTGDDNYFVDNTGDVVTENANEGNDTVYATANTTLSANVENLVLQGSADISGFGNALANVINGNGGANSLVGGGGNDSLFGNAGNDGLDGGAGADTTLGGTGDDTYEVDDPGDVVIENANEGTDRVDSYVSWTLGPNIENLVLYNATNINGTGNELANRIDANLGDNVVSGLGGNDQIFGYAGNDTLDGGTGADTMTGGTGNDAYYMDNAGDVVTENANEGTDTVYASINYVLPANVEVLVLQGVADLQGYGNGAANTLVGNTGNNLLDGGAGADGMLGGAGNDTYFVDNASDGVVENANEGNDSVFSTVSFTLPANVENLVLQGSADVQGYGNAGANVLYGNTGNNLLNGGAGVDLMVGGLGNDTYYVDDPSDSAFEAANQGNDSVFASCNYGIAADVENLILQGTGDFQAYGNNQANVIYGNSGNNLLNGAGGVDLMVGGPGNDTYFVDDPSDACFENPGEGTDAVFASCNYGLAADVETLVMQGGADYQGYGNNQANTLYGNSGNNLLNGAGGADTMAGGVGNDTYFVDNVGDGVAENANEGTDSVFSSVTYALSANVEALVLQGAGNIDGVGNTLANSLFGNSGSNTLDGGGGADQLTGNGGNDMFVFRAGQANGDNVIDFAGNGVLAGDSLQFVGFGTTGATFTQVGVNLWQIHSGIDAHNEFITLSNGAAIDPSDYNFV
jgi:Ca2+-binding RTX toxin-like protein